MVVGSARRDGRHPWNERRASQHTRVAALVAVAALALAAGPAAVRTATTAEAAPVLANVALTENPTVAASSEDASQSQGAAKAIDGSALGYPADPSREWATIGGKGGSWIELTWSAPVTIDRVVLYDRPNLDDGVTSGRLSFSTGPDAIVGSLPNDGSPVVVSVGGRTVTSLRFTIEGVIGSTENVGLAELEVWGYANVVPVADAGPDQAVVTNEQVQLDGTASDDTDGDALEYRWEQTDGTPVTLSDSTSATPEFTAPWVSGTLTFALEVDDGKATSAPDSITVAVSAPGPENLARTADPDVEASSQDVGEGQGVEKAVDGSTLGYPVDATKEWATIGGRAGSWIELAWDEPVTVDRVVLYDRPNLADQAVAGVIAFSDGSQVRVGALADDGAATTVRFRPRSVSSVRFTVSAVSEETLNVGLAEIQIWGHSNTPPVADAGANQTVNADSEVELNAAASHDADGDPLTYEWTQVSGDPVRLSDAAAVMPTFTGPGTAGPLVFALVVDDGTSSSTPDEVTITVLPYGNVARSESPTATASSEDLGLGQGAEKAVDGSTLGYPVDDKREWATVGGLSGSWLNLAWDDPVQVDRVVLHDRPNLVDHVTEGVLEFSDGSTVMVGSLENDGSPTTVTFAARTITSLRFVITDVSAETVNAGLAEIEVWGYAVQSENVARTADPDISASSEDVDQGQGAGKTVDGSTLGYPVDGTKEWATIGGGSGSWIEFRWPAPVRIDAVALYDRPNLVDHVTGATLEFSDGSSISTGALENDGGLVEVAFSARTVTSMRMTVTAVAAGTENVGLAEIEVRGYVLPKENVARTATPVLSASSANTAQGQGASKVVDGSTLGFPVDPTKEWATIGGGSGSWIELSWPSPVRIDRVVLHDRPNLSDHVIESVLGFSASADVSVGQLANDGSATVVDFTPRTTTSLRLDVRQVGVATVNVGLAEIEVWGYSKGVQR